MHPTIELIQPYHDRKSFTCEKQKVNDFLRVEGLSETWGTTWVVVPEPGSPQILAFYTINPDPEEAAESFDSEDSLPAIALEWLGVHHDYSRMGFGKWLLFRVIRQTVELGEERPDLALLTLVPLDSEAREYYLHLDLGFVDLSPDDERLILPMATMRAIVASRSFAPAIPPVDLAG